MYMKNLWMLSEKLEIDYFFRLFKSYLSFRTSE